MTFQCMASGSNEIEIAFWVSTTRDSENEGGVAGPNGAVPLLSQRDESVEQLHGMTWHGLASLDF